MSEPQDPFDFVVINAYTLDEAIADGTLVKVFENRWPELSGGKPIVATAAISQAFSLAAQRELWNDFVIWRRDVMPTLPEEDQMFTAEMNGETVWILEDGAAFTILFREDY
jgi:hypothetical protein